MQMLNVPINWVVMNVDAMQVSVAMDIRVIQRVVTLKQPKKRHNSRQLNARMASITMTRIVHVLTSMSAHSIQIFVM